jgi:hypothetical protein
MSVPRLFSGYFPWLAELQKIASVAIAIRDSLGQESGVGPKFSPRKAPMRDRRGLSRVAFIEKISYVFVGNIPVK